MPFKITRADLVIYAILLLLIGVFWKLNSCDLDIGFLPLRGDDYVWTRSLFYIHKGLTRLIPAELFHFPRGYGCLYFYSIYLLSLPFILAEHYEAIVFITRMFSSVFGVLALLVFYRIARKEDLSFFLATSLTGLLVSMPLFWSLGQRYYPASMAVFFLLLAFYFLVADDGRGRLKGDYGKFLIALSLSVSAKLQLAPFWMLLFIYPLGLFWAGRIDFRTGVRLFLWGVLLSVAIFLITNPYLLHPKGMLAMWREVKYISLMNQTNHGLGNQVTLREKLQGLHLQVVPYILLLFLALLSCWFISAIVFMRGKIGIAYFSIATASLAFFVYLFVFVNKAWPDYYYPVMVAALVLLIGFIKGVSGKRLPGIFATLLLLLQVFSYKQSLASIGRNFYRPCRVAYSKKAVELNASIIKALGSRRHSGLILLSPYTPFQFYRLGIDYLSLESIWWPFDLSYINKQRFDQRMQGLKEFRQPAYIVIRKDDIYFDRSKTKNLTYSKKYREALDMFQKMRQGAFGYRLFFEDQNILVFERATQGE